MEDKKISYRAKTDTVCPICGEKHTREEMFSGGGRLIAGKVNTELRMLWAENKKWGKICPLFYTLDVCPSCFYAAYPKDFNSVDPDEQTALRATMEHRKELISTLFGPVDFHHDRDLITGVASYVMAVDCYYLRNAKLGPTPKKAVLSLRAAWLLEDLFAVAPYRPYDKVSAFYKKESATNYMKTLELMQTGDEPIEEMAGYLGPGADKNWGFDGVIFLNASLTLHYIDEMANTVKGKSDILEKTKRYLSKLYGSGKASKSKPGMIVDMAKDLYDEIGARIEEYQKQLSHG